MSAQPEIVPVLLAGGEGRRLWPLSTPARPKPFLRLPCGRSLLQATAQRVSHFAPPLMVCQARHENLVRTHLAEGNIAVQKLLLEPESRNTAPAVATAAYALSAAHDPVMLVLPTDHAIRRPASFLQAVNDGIPAAKEGRIVLIGLIPTRPASDFGYIRGAGTPVYPSPRAVERFVEKPARDTAQRFLKEGNWLWNSGMFLGRASAFLKAFNENAPHIAKASREALDKAQHKDNSMLLCPDSYRIAPKISLDHAIIEKTPHLSVVSADLGWRDLGTWRSYATYWLEASIFSA